MVANSSIEYLAYTHRTWDDALDNSKPNHFFHEVAVRTKGDLTALAPAFRLSDVCYDANQRAKAADALIASAYWLRIPSAGHQGAVVAVGEAAHAGASSVALATDAATVGIGFLGAAIDFANAVYEVFRSLRQPKSTSADFRLQYAKAKEDAKYWSQRNAIEGASAASNANLRMMVEGKSEFALLVNLDVAVSSYGEEAKNKEVEKSKRRFAEQVMDFLRYGVVSWTGRIAVVLQKFVLGATLCTSILAMVGLFAGAALQFCAGLLKLIRAVKERKAATKLNEAVNLAFKNVRKVTLEKNERSIVKALRCHVQRKINRKIEESRAGGERACVELVVSIGLTVTGVVSLFFPPAIIASAAIGVIYAGYRFVRGVMWYSEKRNYNSSLVQMKNQMTTIGSRADERQIYQTLHAVKKENRLASVALLLDVLLRNVRQEEHWSRRLLGDLGISDIDIFRINLLLEGGRLEEAAKILDAELL